MIDLSKIELSTKQEDFTTEKRTNGEIVYPLKLILKTGFFSKNTVFRVVGSPKTFEPDVGAYVLEYVEADVVDTASGAEKAMKFSAYVFPLDPKELSLEHKKRRAQYKVDKLQPVLVNRASLTLCKNFRNLTDFFMVYEELGEKDSASHEVKEVLGDMRLLFESGVVLETVPEAEDKKLSVMDFTDLSVEQLTKGDRVMKLREEADFDKETALQNTNAYLQKLKSDIEPLTLQ